MEYLRVPQEVNLSEIKKKSFSFSPSMYQKVIMPMSEAKKVADLLDPTKPYDKGVEPGSMWYLRRSTHQFIRTKALQDHSNLLYPKGDAIVPINPRVFKDPALKEEDILMSKDSNIGECAMVHSDFCGNYMFSSGVVRLNPVFDRYYLFAFLKHPLFKTQLHAKAPRGATLRHAKGMWLDCFIPFPSQEDTKRVICYVSALMQAIVDKERALRGKNQRIDDLIEQELERGQRGVRFRYSMPRLREIKDLGRLDASMYVEGFKENQFRIANYEHGSGTYKDMGFEIGRGQNLQLSCIGKSIYSDAPKPNFYRLVAPTDISEYRTVRKFRYLGNKRELSMLKKGDVVFGAEGFCKGRVVILADEVQRTISNIHGVTFHPKDGNMVRGIYLGCFLGYLRAKGIVDTIGAGGSGGSLAIGYFHHVFFPNFPRPKQEEVAKLYHNPAPPPSDTPTLDTFVDWHRRWNEGLGIWELDREMKKLQQTLNEVQEQIIEGKTVTVPLP